MSKKFHPDAMLLHGAFFSQRKDVTSKLDEYGVRCHP